MDQYVFVTLSMEKHDLYGLYGSYDDFVWKVWKLGICMEMYGFLCVGMHISGSNSRV